MKDEKTLFNEFLDWVSFVEAVLGIPFKDFCYDPEASYDEFIFYRNKKSQNMTDEEIYEQFF